MADELIDICDENMAPMGRAMKSLAHKTGLWHQAIHCWFVKRAPTGGTMMFQKRGSDKELFPDFLDITAAGHYQAGEVLQDGIREILEELGQPVPFDQLISLGVKVDLARTPTILNHEFCHTFLYETSMAPSDFQLNRDEVDGLVEIEVAAGLDLFSGNADAARAVGVEWSPGTGDWRPVDRMITRSQFIPRVDAYYYKMFINADRYLSGYKHLAI